MSGADTDWVVEWLLRGADGHEIELSFRPRRCLTVGRDFTSDIPLLDAGVSRHHALISSETSGLWIEDLHSQNGTFVNTQRIHRAPMHEGDIVTFGRLHWTLLGRRRRRNRNADLLRPLSSQDLARLLDLCRRVNAHQDPATAIERLLDGIVEALHAERGAILLYEPAREDLLLVAARPTEETHRLEPLARSPLSRTILQSGTTQSFHSTHPPYSEPEHTREPPRAIAPLYDRQRPLGLIYLDRRGLDRPFAKAEVDFLAAFSWVVETTFAESGAFALTPARADDLASRWRKPRSRAESLETGQERVRALPGLDPASMLSYLARELALARERLAQGAPESHGQAALDLRRIALYAEASRILHGREETHRKLANLQAVVADAGREWAPDESSWRFRAEEPLKILTVVASLKVVLGLLADACAGDRGGGGGAGKGGLTIEAKVETHRERRLLRLSFLEPPPSEREGGEHPEGNLPLELARRIAASHLKGQVRARAPGGPVELELPTGLESLQDTVAF